MPFWFFTRPINQQECFEVQDVPEGVVMNKVYARVQPAGVLAVAVEAPTRKKAIKEAEARIETDLKRIKDEQPRNRIVR
jgi:hypothetical protein